MIPEFPFPALVLLPVVEGTPYFAGHDPPVVQHNIPNPVQQAACNWSTSGSIDG